MSFLKSIFGRKKENAQESEEKTLVTGSVEKGSDRQGEKEADILKFDALRAMKMGKVAFALKALTKALELRPEFETRFYYAEALTLNGQETEALKQYDLLLEEYPQHSLCLKNRASLKIVAEDYKGALEDIELALQVEEAEEQRIVLYQQRAKAYLMLQEFDKACAAAEEAIVLKTPFPAAYLYKTEALIGLQRLEEANSFVQEALSLFPEEERFSLLQAKIALVQKDYTAAYRAYQDTLEKDPFSEEAYCGITCLMVQEGKSEEAIDFLERALEEQSLGYTTLSLLANLYRKKGLVEKEQKLQEQMKELASSEEAGPVDFIQLYYKGTAYGEIFGNLMS